MTEKRDDNLKAEIESEFKLLARTILAKLRKLFLETDLPYNEDDFIMLEESKDNIKMSFLIPYVTKFQIANDGQNPHETARSLINSALKLLRAEFSCMDDFRSSECNLRYTGFSISPFGLVMQVPKERLVAAKFRKISAEILASFSLEELKEQADEENTISLKLPNDLLYAALGKRRQKAEAFVIPNDEFDVREIDEQLLGVKSLIKQSFRNVSLVAS